jgi:hypothetical protein
MATVLIPDNDTSKGLTPDIKTNLLINKVENET